ncbi:acyl carrier protein [Enterocloster clostridioformis]
MSTITGLSELILKMIADILELSVDNVSEEQNFIEIGMISIGFINLIIKCETEFDIEFEDDKFLMSNFSTISDFISYVQSLTL